MSAVRSSRRTALLTMLGILLLILGVGAGSPLHAQTAASTPTPLPLYALPDANTNRAFVSRSIALSAADAREVLAVNFLNDTVSIATPTLNRLAAEIPVGDDPRSIAVTPDNRALIANHGADTLSVIDIGRREVITTLDLGGVSPYGVVAGDNSRAYVTLQHSSAVAVVDLTRYAVTAHIPTPPMPTALALWGDFLYVSHFWTGEISLIYLPVGRVVQTTRTGADTALFAAIEPDITRGIAYLPQTRLNAQNPRLTFDTIAFPVVNVLDLRGLSVIRPAQIALDTADRPVNMPFAAALDRFAQRLYVANAGTNDISVIDLNTGQARGNIKVGLNPRGLILNPNSTILYVHSALDNTITTINTETLTINSVLPISVVNVPADVLLGAHLFHRADDPRLNQDGWVSCATCHFDGGSDGRVWMGFPDGPRNTPHLYLLPETPPYTWSGGWDEIADVEIKIRQIGAGTGLLEGMPANEPLGLPHSGASADLDVLTAYIVSLRPPRNPTQFDPDLVQRGRDVFEASGCPQCHVGRVGTDLQPYDVGTASPLEQRGPMFDTPSLRFLWLSAPYFHDGSAASLRDVFFRGGPHSAASTAPPEALHALEAYLLAWPETDIP